MLQRDRPLQSREGFCLFDLIRRSVKVKLGLLLATATVILLIGVQMHDWQHARMRVKQYRKLNLPASASTARNDPAYQWIVSQAHKEKVDLWVSVAFGLLGLGALFVLILRSQYESHKLIQQARVMATGDYRRRITACRDHSLKAIGESFNTMAENLQNQEQTLTKQAEILAGMLDAARVISATLDTQQCGKEVAKAVCSHLGATDVSVFLRNEEGGTYVIARAGKPHKADWVRLAAHSMDSGSYIVVGEHDHYGEPCTSLVGTPISVGEKMMGAIVARFGAVYSREELSPGSLRADALMTLATHTATAMTTICLISQTQEYSRSLEEWVEYIAALSQVTTAIAPSLNLVKTLDALTKASAEATQADYRVIFIPDQEGHLIPRSSFPDDFPISALSAHAVSYRAFEEKQLSFCEDINEHPDPIVREYADRYGLRGIISAPLLIENEVIGCISIYSHSPRKYSEKEQQLVGSIATHAAIVVHNAKLYQTESAIAETLQHSLMSRVPSDYGNLRFYGRYVPGQTEASVGGDFYDVTPLRNGTVAVAMADVSGKGLEAAIHLAACKYMLKALVHTHPDDPAATLTALNDSINSSFKQEFFVTLFHAVINPADGSLIYASAGHPPAIIKDKEASLHTRLVGSGIPLGTGWDCVYDNQSALLKHGDILLLYTDGVTDAVKDGDRIELEGLDQMLFESGCCSGDELVDQLIDRINNECDPARLDDMAALAVTFKNGDSK